MFENVVNIPLYNNLNSKYWQYITLSIVKPLAWSQNSLFGQYIEAYLERFSHV